MTHSSYILRIIYQRWYRALELAQPLFPFESLISQEEGCDSCTGKHSRREELEPRARKGLGNEGRHDHSIARAAMYQILKSMNPNWICRTVSLSCDYKRVNLEVAILPPKIAS